MDKKRSVLVSGMKKSFRKSLCRGTESVDTIDSNNFRVKLSFPPYLGLRKQHSAEEPVEDFSAISPSLISSYNMLSEDDLSAPPTLEEMLARLDEEEEEEEASAQLAELMALSNFGSLNPRRMSSVNNSDLMRAAKSALNSEYPRFSVDGRDHLKQTRPATDLPPDLTAKKSAMNKENEFSEGFRKPCLVERLMGLETMPVHTPSPSRKHYNTLLRNCYVGMQNLKDLSGATRIESRRFMVQQPKPCMGMILEKQKHQKPPPPPRDVKQNRQVFGSYQKSAIKNPLGMGQATAAGPVSYIQSKKLQASSSKAQELLVKNKPDYSTSMEKDKKRSNCRICNSKVPSKS